MSGHHHHHNHIDPQAGDKRLIWAMVVNFALTIVQLIGGVVSGSLALIADAIHNLSDAVSLFIAYIARKIGRKPSNDTMTFGYQRAEVIAALINYVTLIIVGLYLIYEAVIRFFNPVGVDGWMVVVIALVALIIDLGTVALTYAMSKNSMNIRAAFLHNISDALGSVAVIVAGTVIILYDWRLIDPLVTLMIAGYILWQAIAEIGGVIRVLMLGCPPEVDIHLVLDVMKNVDGVDDVHHLHVWQMNEHENSLDAHLVIEAGSWRDGDAIKGVVKSQLLDRFNIAHVVLEIECSRHACEQRPVVGHEGIKNIEAHHHHE